MSVDQAQVQEIVDRVRARFAEAGSPLTGAGLRARAELEEVADVELGDGIFRTIDEAVEAHVVAPHAGPRGI